MRHHVQLNLLGVLHRLEERRARRYTYMEIAAASGLTRQGIRYLLKSPPKRVDMDTLAKLLDFFRSEGLDISIADLFVVTEPDA